MRRRAKDAGIAHLHPHLFRHTFAHQWLDSGGEENDLRRLADWRSPNMVARYRRFGVDDSMRAVGYLHMAKPRRDVAPSRSTRSARGVGSCTEADVCAVGGIRGRALLQVSAPKQSAVGVARGAATADHHHVSLKAYEEAASCSVVSWNRRLACVSKSMP